MKIIKSIIGWVVTFIGGISVISWFFGFSDWVTETVSQNRILIIMALGVFGFFAYIIHDADLENKKARHRSRLSGSSKRTKKPPQSRAKRKRRR